jgi:hypothetical protein
MIDWPISHPQRHTSTDALEQRVAQLRADITVVLAKSVLVRTQLTDYVDHLRKEASI